jgi:hypothetical protein
MKWHLSRRDVVTFALIIVGCEAVFLLGRQGPFAYAIGLLMPLAILFLINLIVGATRSANDSDREG